MRAENTMPAGAWRAVAAIATALVLSGCGTTEWTSTWKDPDAAPLTRAAGQTVMACVATDDEPLRHAAEDALAAELGRRGVRGVPSYRVLARGQRDEGVAKKAFQELGAVAAVVVRPVRVDRETSLTRPVYTGPQYRAFYGGYWGHAWGYPYAPATVSTETLVTVETLFYSLEQNRLVWAGRSRTTNPSNVADFVRELVVSAAREMNRAGVFGQKE